MPREPYAYRDNLEDLLSFFGGKRLLTIKDVAQYTGRTEKWCKKRFQIDPSKRISVPTLARMLCEVST